MTAAQTAKSFTIFRKVRGQQPYAEWFPPRKHGDAAVARAQEALHSRFPDADVLSGAVAASGLTPRTFKRRFKAGDRPVRDRLHPASPGQGGPVSLETTNNSIEEIGRAEPAIGTSLFFRTLFRRLVGLTPASTREQFGLLEYPGADPLDAIAEIL